MFVSFCTIWILFWMYPKQHNYLSEVVFRFTSAGEREDYISFAMVYFDEPQWRCITPHLQGWTKWAFHILSLHVRGVLGSPACQCQRQTHKLETVGARSSTTAASDAAAATVTCPPLTKRNLKVKQSTFFFFLTNNKNWKKQKKKQGMPLSWHKTSHMYVMVWFFHLGFPG